MSVALLLLVILSGVIVVKCTPCCLKYFCRGIMSNQDRLISDSV